MDSPFSQFSPPPFPAAISAPKATLKVLTFTVGSLNLALRLDPVSRILRHAPIYGSSPSSDGRIRIDERELPIVDLPRRLFHSSWLRAGNDTTPAIAPFAILLRGSDGERVGLPIPAAPSLADIAIAAIRVLPPSYRQADTLGIASHVAVVPHGEGTLTLCLLDPIYLYPNS
jgi:purine-binding chemotaxis protein CheW